MLDSLWGGIQDFLGDTLSSILEAILNATIFKLCYYIETALCRIINILTQLFMVFSGIEKASYDGNRDYLINIFFSNKVVNNIYWGMAMIGLVLVFVFTMWAVIQKMFDLSGKHQQSMGQIIGAAIRSIFLILSMTLVINVVLSSTNILMQQVNYIFNDAYHLDQPRTKKFTEYEYAAMGRVLATIGNYAVVPNSNNRYNLNLCYNDIRGDLLYLEQEGVFDYSYYEVDSEGKELQTWQSVLAKIAKSTDLSVDAKVDVYQQGIAESLTDAMDYLKNNGTTIAKEDVSRKFNADEDIHLDRMVFLMGTLGAAKNNSYNQDPSMDDALRGPYYYAEGRNIYSFDNVTSDFEIGFATDYILVWLTSMAIIFDLVVIILNCIARIFNMLFLYVIAPPIIAVTPMDGGGKFKQWSTAFIIQSLSVFGTVISMRILLIYLPLVMSPKLVLIPDNSLLNMLAKFMLVYGGFEAAKKATSLFTGILADNAGWQSIMAGDMSSSAGSLVGAAKGAVGKAAGKALGMAGSVAGFALSPVTNTIKQPFQALGQKWKNLSPWNFGGQSPQQQMAQSMSNIEKMMQNQQNQPAPPPGPGPQNGSQPVPGPQNGSQPGPGPNAPQNPANLNNPANQGNQQPPAQGNNGVAQAPPRLPNRGNSNEAPTTMSGARSTQNLRQQYGFGGGAPAQQGGGGAQPGAQGAGNAGPGVAPANQHAPAQQGGEAAQPGAQQGNAGPQAPPRRTFRDDFNIPRNRPRI